MVVYRIVLFFRDSSERKVWSELDLHKKIVQISYYIFYSVTLFMTLSGFVIYFYETLSLSKELAHDIKEVHELVYNYILIFVPIHIAGVVIAENEEEKGLVSSMINGRKFYK
jgi:Ni,Fe-hydrogenase I cytochrome b subunit